MAAKPGSRFSRKAAKAGAVDLAMDPSNPKVLYAGLLAGQPQALALSIPAAMAAGSGNRPTAGDTWTDLSHAPGLPKGVEGRVAVTISPVNPERVWAMVESLRWRSVSLR